MGVNFPDIRYIITWGAARSLLDFRQEAGRAEVSSQRLFAEVDFGGVAAVNSVILPCNDSWTNEYSDPRFRIFRAQGYYKRDLNACHTLLLQIQLSEGFEPKFHPCSPSFSTD